VRGSGAPRATARFAARQISASDKARRRLRRRPAGVDDRQLARRCAAHDMRDVIPAMLRCSRPPFIPPLAPTPPAPRLRSVARQRYHYRAAMRPEVGSGGPGKLGGRIEVWLVQVQVQFAVAVSFRLP
jgi:hypothetical protein